MTEHTEMTDLAEINAQYRYWCGDSAPLAEWIRSGMPISQGTRDMLADILEGNFKKRRGPKEKSPYSKPLIFIVKYAYNEERKQLKDREEKAAHNAACEAVAELFDVTPDWVDKTIYRRKPSPKK